MESLTGKELRTLTKTRLLCESKDKYEEKKINGIHIWKIQVTIQAAVLCLVDQLCPTDQFVTPWTIAHQAPLSMGILQARILDWVTIPSSRGSSQPGDQTQVSHIAGRFFTL